MLDLMLRTAVLLVKRHTQPTSLRSADRSGRRMKRAPSRAPLYPQLREVVSKDSSAPVFPPLGPPSNDGQDKEPGWGWPTL